MDHAVPAVVVLDLGAPVEAVAVATAKIHSERPLAVAVVLGGHASYLDQEEVLVALYEGKAKVQHEAQKQTGELGLGRMVVHLEAQPTACQRDLFVVLLRLLAEYQVAYPSHEEFLKIQEELQEHQLGQVQVHDHDCPA